MPLGDLMLGSSVDGLCRAKKFRNPSRDSLFADRGCFSAAARLLSSIVALITKSGGLILRDNLLGVSVVSVGVETECLEMGSAVSVISLESTSGW